jgi:hypothetical protein
MDVSVSAAQPVLASGPSTELAPLAMDVSVSAAQTGPTVTPGAAAQGVSAAQEAPASMISSIGTTDASAAAAAHEFTTAINSANKETAQAAITTMVDSVVDHISLLHSMGSHDEAQKLIDEASSQIEKSPLFLANDPLTLAQDARLTDLRSLIPHSHESGPNTAATILDATAKLDSSIATLAQSVKPVTTPVAAANDGYGETVAVNQYGEKEPDATTNVNTDATTNATTDATTDATTNVNTDATTDATTDVTTDATTNVNTDAITDTTTDVTTDVTTDANVQGNAQGNAEETPTVQEGMIGGSIADMAATGLSAGVGETGVDMSSASSLPAIASSLQTLSEAVKQMNDTVGTIPATLATAQENMKQAVDQSYKGALPKLVNASKKAAEDVVNKTGSPSYMSGDPGTYMSGPPVGGRRRMTPKKKKKRASIKSR